MSLAGLVDAALDDPALATVIEAAGRSGARVVVGVAGRQPGAVRADAAGSFQASWLTGALVAGATVSAADAGCSA
ncbi:MAG: hypothetical protein ABI047_07270, partial [Jatrophihabitantaceae bacterium]